MKIILAIAATLLLTNNPQVLAGNARTVSEKDVDSNAIELKVWKGYGLTINLMFTGEIIKQVWIGDPTRFAFTSNGSLCPKGGDKPDCDVGKATVIFVRQIQPIKFPVTSSSNGSTQITVLTNQKQYQFKLTPATGEPSYTSLVIKPDSEKPEPLPVIREQRQLIVVKKPTPSSEEIIVREEGRRQEAEGRRWQYSVDNSWRRFGNRPTLIAPHQISDLEWGLNPRPIWSRQRTECSIPSASCPLTSAFLPKPQNIVIVRSTPRTVPSGSIQRNDANAVVAGLAVANRNGQIKSGSTTWKKAQDAIRLLRQGKNKQEAVSRSGISQAVFNQLIEWGKRP